LNQNILTDNLFDSDLIRGSLDEPVRGTRNETKLRYRLAFKQVKGDLGQIRSVPIIISLNPAHYNFYAISA